MENLQRRHADRRAPVPINEPGYVRMAVRARVAQTVLLAEPDTALAELYRSALEADGWAVDVVRDGLSALTRATATLPGVLLLSTVADFPAVTVLRRLRDDESTRDLPVIVLTNFGHQVDAQRWRELGALGRLEKTRSMRGRLSESIIDLLDRRGSGGDRRVPTRPGPKPLES